MKHATEHEEQATFFDWVRWKENRDDRYEQIYAIANGQLRKTAVGVRLKREGVRAGVLDISIDVPMGRFHGAKIEMKRTGERLTDKQGRAMERNRRYGYACTMARTGSEAILWVMSYFQEPRDAIARKAVELGYNKEIPDVHANDG